VTTTLTASKLLVTCPLMVPIRLQPIVSIHSKRYSIWSSCRQVYSKSNCR